MMLNTKSVLFFILFVPFVSAAQQDPVQSRDSMNSPVLIPDSTKGSGLAQDSMKGPVLTLDSIMQRIDRNNSLLQSYALKAEAYRQNAEAATAWMAPMVGLGTFMTPYPFQTVMDSRDKGSLMLRAEQEIPSRAKLNARKKYISSQGNIEMANRSVTMNDFRSQAKSIYYNWLVSTKKINVLRENRTVLQTMKKIEELRFPYNQSQLGNIYRIEARLEENENMIRMEEGEIKSSMAWLNSLMNLPGTEEFDIDTTMEPAFSPAFHDTLSLASVRGDIHRMNESIKTMQLNTEAMRLERKPVFRIQFDHMSSFSSMMPRAFSVMGMVSLPIVPWASKMYKSEIKAMQFNVEAMQKEREGMLRETQGMLYGMQSQIRTMQQRIETLEEKIIPAMQKSLDANFLNYQENRIQVPVVIDSWEGLNMLKLELLDEKQKLYQMIVDYEKEIYR